MSDSTAQGKASEAGPRLFTPWVKGVIGRFGLPSWFLALTIARLGFLGPSLLATDANLYIAAARRFVGGLDPWQASVTNAQSTFHYAGAPPTVLLTVPLTALPDPAAAAVLMLAGIVAGALTVRVLRLPWWWIAFPPLVEAMFVGNPHTIVLALLVAGPRFVAPLVKVYGIAPLLAERRVGSVFLCVLSTTATIAIAPGLWSTYAEEFGATTRRLTTEAGGFSAWALPALTPLLVPIAIASLILIARRDLGRTGWLAVPALWPATQFMYASFVMPVAWSVSAAIAAVPFPGLFVLALVVEAARAVRGRRRDTSGVNVQPE